jgi:hypothetical protein
MEAPKTIAEVMETISKLRSRRAILDVNKSHLRNVYTKTDAGPPESRITRDDLAFVPASHIEDAIIDMEHEIELIDARLEELQNAPIGGGGAPAAAALPAQTEDDKIAEAVRAQAKEGKKGTTSGKTRAQGSRPD